ncbi:MAG: hypothetical protein OXF41_02435 [bacterium]|nr:hypothetical protein [bacterium]
MEGGSAFLPAHGPLNQGDILIAPVARVAASNLFVPDKWDRLDQTEHEVDRSPLGEDSIHVLSGRALVMVTSHDCHHDKEWNTERSRLIRSGMDPQEAEAIAEEDPTLDRTFQASPLVPLDDLERDSRGNYRAGRLVGFFPLPASPDGSFPECVVDLTYRCTIDREAVTTRRWCLSPVERNRLRYAIARFDSFRTFELAEEIEAAIGKSISGVRIETGPGFTIELVLDDASILRLVRPPAEPDPSGRTTM